MVVSENVRNLSQKDMLDTSMVVKQLNCKPYSNAVDA